ncbi:hypothetical protein K502DRAFT_325308 [Neoconidiobolus thromboides FSU 785]|nr:hypothetical protein K502DRAFT_325308 [Neoconidiobolus thromboides FSU 785]
MERLAKVTIVDSNGRLVYNAFVKSSKQVVNYNRKVYGFTSEDFNKGKPFLKVQEEVKDIIEGRVLIGANLNKSLSLLNITHPKINSCDIVKFRPLLKVNCGRPLTLKKISKHLLGLWIQDKPIDIVEDSYACMAIYSIIKRSIKNPNPVEIKAGDDIELLPTKNKPKEIKKNKRKGTQPSSKFDKPPKKEKTEK